VPGFRDLYGWCALTWTGQVEQRVVEATTGRGNAEPRFAWSLRGGLSRTAFRAMDSRAALATYRSRLAPAEIDRVRELTADVASRYYDDAEGLT
jgi:hypothetical protein